MGFVLDLLSAFKDTSGVWGLPLHMKPKRFQRTMVSIDRAPRESPSAASERGF